MEFAVRTWEWLLAQHVVSESEVASRSESAVVLTVAAMTDFEFALKMPPLLKVIQKSRVRPWLDLDHSARKTPSCPCPCPSTRS
jgi:hypothetical protein